MTIVLPEELRQNGLRIVEETMAHLRVQKERWRWPDGVLVRIEMQGHRNAQELARREVDQAAAARAARSASGRRRAQGRRKR